MVDDVGMRFRCVRICVWVLGVCGGGLAGYGQAAGAAAAPVERRDAQVEAGASFIGKGTFLRCFCGENTLAFDATGKLTGTSRTVDWTLAAVNVQKVERKGTSVELDGVRTVIRYNPDNHEFQRKPQADEKVRITVADTGDAAAFQRALEAVFTMGIELPWQHAMPDYWRHYFDPKADWGKDELSGVPIYLSGPAGLVVGAAVPGPNDKVGPAVTSVVVLKKAEPGYTGFAQRDHVQGTVGLRMVVDAAGVPRRIAVTQPLGYGLDEKAVEAVAKMRFEPAMREGKPVASSVLLNQQFVLVPGQ